MSKCRIYCSIESRRIDSRRTANGLMLTDDDCDPPAAAATHAAANMDATTTVFKWTRSPSPSSGEVHEYSAKFSKCNAHSFTSVAVLPLSPNARTVPPCQPQPLQPLSSKFIIFCSAEGNRCFVNHGKVTRAIYSSIFAKKYIEKILTITGGGRGIKFEVANLENLSRSLESVTSHHAGGVVCQMLGCDRR